MDRENEKKRAGQNRTLHLNEKESAWYAARGLQINEAQELPAVLNHTFLGEMEEVVSYLPSTFVDLLFLDPPYNLTKLFADTRFMARSVTEYTALFESWFITLLPLLKPTASVYICGDWHTSASIYAVVMRYLRVRNRITWEREKGRGALRNWKNTSEDIWFCTVSDEYTFNLEAVKLRKRVIAPYRDDAGQAKDWQEEAAGKYRLTHPANLWTDLTVPFWSMPENTDHPTQKPEKLLAKLILASSNPGDVVLDPFLGSGTAAVVAKKLGRQYVGIERERSYLALAEKRLEMADQDQTIQGYRDGVFWERNSVSLQNKKNIKGKFLFDSDI